jgi:hypothetical protein
MTFSSVPRQPVFVGASVGASANLWEFIVLEINGLRRRYGGYKVHHPPKTAQKSLINQ